MRLRATCDTGKGDAALDAFARAVHDVAAVRAANTLADQAETAGFRKVAELYQIPARTMAQYASRKDARAGDAQAEIRVRGKGFPIGLFKPVQTANGVSVVIKGRRVVVPHSFLIAKIGSGHVFARGSYGGKGKTVPTGETSGRFAFGRKRLPISELFTFGPADAFGNREVTAAMDSRVEEQSAAVIAREIAAVRRGF